MFGVNLSPVFAQSRRPSAWRLLTLVVVPCMLWRCLPEASAQQRRLRVQPVGPRLNAGDSSRYRNPYAAVLHPSEEATTLMSRAKQGIEREDWKLVIDSLQRIVELPGEHVLTSDGQVYESARRQAHRKIASLPPAGLAAYRLMYDSEAAALLAQAVDRHDIALLRSIVDRYLVTRAGGQAAITLADWLIDEGQFAEAVAVLQLIKSIYPQSELPRGLLSSRLAVCYAAMGRRQRAEAALNQVAASRPAGETAAPPDRLEQIRAFVKLPFNGDPLVKADQTPDSSAWPLAYGRASRDGAMPTVEPSFTDSHSLIAPLNVSEQLTGLEEYARKRKLLPTASMVADNRILVVKSGPVLQALDMDTFEVLWRREPGFGKDEPAIIEEPPGPLGWQQQIEMQRENYDPLLDANAVVKLLLRDTVSSGLTIAGGVVLTVEWIGDSPNVASPDLPIGWPGAAGFNASHPNRIVAYSLKDGNQVWESTRTAESKLGLVEYLSAPIPVDGLLLAPCRVNTDLYAAVLDPATGRLMRHIYVCGTGGGSFNSLYALSPCAADGVVYVPTGRGVLIAVEASSWSIRWAVRYDSLVERPANESWLPTPVIAVADSVLLAPPDADELFCLDRATGELRWHVARGDSSCVLGATDRYVWLGGQQVQLVNVETGQVVWKRTVAEPSGRGVLAGDRIYLPTISGLVALNATTGAPIDLKGTAEPLVLGNLLAFNNTLYSTDTVSTREFPDMQRGYAEALKRHQEDPAAPAPAIRLARLELLRHSPDQALAALEKIPETLKTANPRRYEQTNHLRVAAMLDLSSSGDVPSQKARELLEQARRIALSSQDAVDSALALGDYQRREHRPLEACLQYLTLVLSREGDQMVSEAEDFRQRARSMAVRRVADTAKALDAQGSAKLEETVRRALRDAESGHDANAALWLAESPALGAVSSEAQLLLGRWAADDLRFEQAEGCFNAVLRRGPSPVLQAEATARLAALYLQPDELHLPLSAAKLLDRLEHDFASLEIPAGVLAVGTDGATTTRPAEPSEKLPAARVAAELRKRVDRKALARHQAATQGITLGAAREPTTALTRGARPLLLRDPHSEPLIDRQLVLVDGKRVQAQRADNGNVLWPAELRLLNELAVESRVDDMAAEQQRIYGPTSGPTLPARALADGQTLVVNSAYGIHAIGLLTGRRLWSRRFDPPVIRPQQERAASDAWLWVHDGYVISVDRSGELDVAAVTAGDRLLWSRKRPGRHWYAVRARGPYVVAVDERLEKVDVFRLEDGRYLGSCEFKQNANPKNITLFEDVICGPASDSEVAALELATPGVERWRVSTDSDLAQLFKPSADLLAISDRSGRVQLIDPRTGGRHMSTVRVQACSDGITDGTLENGIFYVCGFKKRASGTADYSQQRWGLAAIRVRDAAVLWEQDDFGAYAHLNQDVLDAAANAIPVAVLNLTNEGNLQFRAGAGGIRSGLGAQVDLTVLDKATGKRTGQTISAPVNAEAGASRILNVQVRPGQIQVTAGTARLSFPFGSGPATNAASRPAFSEGPPAEIDVGKSREESK